MTNEGATNNGISPKIQQRLKDCVSTSPVTIVVGPTGCGKSTKVPPFLLKNLGGPILCTQPRRLAVVTVASRVAQERGVRLGGLEVGYHVGQANHSQANTKLVFTTAGILLEELRAQGYKALTKYKVVVLDECHERSNEQELCLAMCKLFLQQKRQSKIRIVLMSATFDHQRYKNYFAGLDVPIDTITLETANMVDAMYERVETLYLEDIKALLHSNDSTIKHSRFLQMMRIDPEAELRGEDGGKSLSLGLLSFLRSLVLHLDEEEPVDKAIMIFAPTYQQLEQIYEILTSIHQIGENNTHPWRVGVLHSSMDMEDCLQTMQPDNLDTREGVRFRKILLASAIADSSVTIPGVSCVIDICRALQVRWDPNKRSHVAKTTWASQSICNQRQGRTGRTCPGRCFRLLSKGFFIGRLEPFDEPQLATASCRNEVLKLLCSMASTNASTDPIQIMKQCLDPPPPEVVQDAFQYLQSIGACVAQGKKGTYLPTKMGDLMAAMPLAVEDSRIVVVGAQLGLLHETLALRAIMSHKPAPIVHHFGDNAVNDANILCYYDQAAVGTPESVHMANLSAYLYWDVTWNQYRSRAAIEQFAVTTGSSTQYSPDVAEFASSEAVASKPCCDLWGWCPKQEEKHTQWCRARGINPTSVHGVKELIDTVLNVFYVAGLEPEWLRATDPTPLWRRFGDWKGMQLNDYVNTRDVLAMVYDFPTGQHRLSKTLMALSTDSVKAMSEMTKEHILDVASLTSNAPVRNIHKATTPPTACVHFLEGRCTFGARCRNSHAPFAVRPICKFYRLSDGCSRGDKCIFSHEAPQQRTLFGNPENDNMQKDPLTSVAPIIDALKLPDDIVDWFEEHHRTLFLLGDGNFEFTRSLATLGVSPRYASNEHTDMTKIGNTDIVQLDATRMHLNDLVHTVVAAEKVDTFLWNFPFTGSEEHDEGNESLILGTFHSLLQVFRGAVRTHHDPLTLTFAIALQGDQFSRWNINRAAMRTGWRLCAWGPYPINDFPGYKPRRANSDAFPAVDPRLYEFKIYSGQLRA